MNDAAQAEELAQETFLANAAVEAYRAAIESAIGFGIWALQALPTIVLWAIALFVPGRWTWKRMRRTSVSQS
jgi:hypothetical protein